ncbi:nuclease-related domain-containing protein [Anoxybacteroides tepidamans]|uniref:nuclease-related domain-containing protein n=1 Tax=Anoxybacteroides tepidamans TaxID=265948 RepID=UPI000686946D|nr:nuclease-related domain-containing protein [Anoxybacillus tepidamans]
MDVVLIIIIVFLTTWCISLYQKQKQIKQTLSQVQAQAAVTVQMEKEKEKNQYENKMEKVKQVVAKKIHEYEIEKKEYQAQISDYKDNIKKCEKTISEQSNQIEELHNQIDSLKRMQRNRGEVITHKILTDLKDRLVREGKINRNEMIVIPNVFVPYTENKVMKMRQIDHLVLLPTDIYIIETKYWKGKVLHGLTKEKAGDFSFILDALFPKQQSDAEQTIVFVKENINDNNETGSMKIVSYENPSKQVMNAMGNLRAYLMDLNQKFNYVEPILYYGYDSDDFNEVTIYSEKGKPNVFKSEKELIDYFEEQLTKRKKFTVKDLEEIKRIVEQVNYIS